MKDLGADNNDFLAPLKASFAENALERELNALLVDVFEQLLDSPLFDVHVAGSAHLGSLELIRQSIHRDGLAILPNSTGQYAIRYLYRAWMSRNGQGRGLHFLRTYLQLLFPNLGEVKQLWQHKDAPYPNDLSVASSPQRFLTSRVQMQINSAPNAAAVNLLNQVISQVAPARMVVLAKFVVTSHAYDMRVSAAGHGRMELNSYGVLFGLTSGAKADVLAAQVGRLTQRYDSIGTLEVAQNNKPLHIAQSNSLTQQLNSRGQLRSD